ncbi:MAG: phospholipid carrier-dependent glycosyltransferase [Ardenticatenales bacterium]|nr:phospholipid carrier-dependent glycosyltransferase [Ardenticatenales bacterium]
MSKTLFPTHPKPNPWTIWPAAALLLLMYALAVTSLVRQSPTFDEQGFLTRGVAYLRDANRAIRVGHPLGLNALNAAFLAADDAVRLPTDDPAWVGTNFHRPSELFMWEIGNDVSRIMLEGRLPTVWLGMLLAALVGRWAWRISRRRHAGLLALALIALDPNILAHTQLATTDLGLAAGAALAGYALWRYLRWPGWLRVIIAGVAFALLQDTKFTAGLFVPLFALVILVGLWRQPRAARPAMLRQLLIGFPLSALLALWAAYGFQVGTMPTNLPTLPQLSGLTLPLSHHLEQLLDIGGRLQKVTPAFLLGHYSDSGWWTYFPVAFLLKTPLPSLLLLAWGAGYAAWRWWRGRTLPFAGIDAAVLLIPPLGYFAIALTSDINLGYRHLLPLLPFLAVFVAVALSRLDGKPRWAAVGLAGWLGAASLLIAPHHLSFFNILAGGPDGGWRYLVDSNIDWGQDLAGLPPWMAENGVPWVYLSYFGEARPDYYGIAYRGLASFPPRLMDAGARIFYPSDPAPGVYAISVTNLQGVLFADHDLYAWFRQRQPIAKIGYSIFLYEVPASTPPINLILSGVQLDEIAPADHALLAGNDLRLRWQFPYQAWLQPADAPAYYALATPPPPAFAASLEPIATNAAYTLYRADPAAVASPPVPAVTLRLDDGQISAYPDAPQTITIAPGTDLVWRTVWRQDGEPTPVKIFLHLIAADGQIATQWDGLGIVAAGWQRGDLLMQTHAIHLEPSFAPGTYAVVAGLYRPADGARWRTPAGADTLNLGTVIVP